MHQEHSSDKTASTQYVSPLDIQNLQQPASLVTLDPSAYQPIRRRPVPNASPPQFRKLSHSAAAPARLPRTSSLLPPPRTVAAAATTAATLTPVYSPSEENPLHHDYSSRLDILPVTPPNEPEYDTESETKPFSSRIELPILTLPPIFPLGPLDDTIPARPSSLEVLPGGDASDLDIIGTSPPKSESAASSDPLPTMPYETVREPYAPATRGHSRSRNGKSSVDLTKPRTIKPPSQKAMLSRALQKANTAVQLDNAQNFEGARESYAEACELLQHVLAKTTTDEDKKKLEAIVSAPALRHPFGVE